MIYIKEAELSELAKGPSLSETQKIQHTRRLVEERLGVHLPINTIKKQFSLSDYKYNVYLQGSYANSTNIKKESDIDIVVELSSIFYPDLQQLNSVQKSLYNSNRGNSSEYTFSQFKENIYQALVSSFGAENVKKKAKCITVFENTNRVSADVVPCFTYKLFSQYYSFTESVSVSGIKFFNTENGEEKISFPKIHLKNGETKNQNTGGKYKDMTRILKNFRILGEDSRDLLIDFIPSFFIESLVYNCPDIYLVGTYKDILSRLIIFLEATLIANSYTKFVCPDGIQKLFDDKIGFKKGQLESFVLFLKTKVYITN